MKALNRKSQRPGRTRSDWGNFDVESEGDVPALSTEEVTERPWSASKRTWISVLLAFHVFAVAVGPWSAPPPSSSLSGLVASWLSPYLFSLHINHGYRFFAPNPGPSHLVRYEVTRGDEKLAAGSFPDRQAHWPRLLYHRFFMTSESMYGLSERVLTPPEAPQAAEGELIDPLVQNEFAATLVSYEREKKKSTTLADGLARPWQALYPDADVRLWVVEHGIPSPPAVELQKMSLSDPSLYRERLLGEWKKATP